MHSYEKSGLKLFQYFVFKIKNNKNIKMLKKIIKNIV